MPVRVIAGSAKGKKLALVPGDSTRPIMDRVKEALFNIIGNDIRDAGFLDMFAGTGSVGIEALSRGASHALFVENDRLAVKTIYANLTHTGLAGRATVRQTNALTLLSRPTTAGYDFIFIAPPQYQGLWLESLEVVDKSSGWLSPDGLVIVQIDPREESEISLRRLQEIDRRKYGNTVLWFFEAPPASEDDQSSAVP
jgi:16S rRNA (guanine966-N2)-methyltransferase